MTDPRIGSDQVSGSDSMVSATTAEGGQYQGEDVMRRRGTHTFEGRARRPSGLVPVGFQ